MNQKEIIKLCKELGCCDACCLRYLGLKSPTAYEDAAQFILKLKNTPIPPQDSEAKTENERTALKEQNNATVDSHVAFVSDTPTEHDTNPAPPCNTNQLRQEDDNPTEGDTTDPSLDTGDPPAKRMKTDTVCVSCIGVLQEESWPQCYKMVKEVLDKKCYECDTFACALSAPIATILRERYVALQLKEHFPDYDESSLTPLKEAWKWSFGVQLAAHARKTLDSGAVSPLLVTVTMEYADDLQELEVLKSLSPSLFESRSRQRRRFTVEFTRRSVEQALGGATLAALRGAWRAARGAGGAGVRPAPAASAPPAPAAGAPLAPPAPAARAACVSVACAHAPLYLGGRYVKLSRALPQTPWLVNGRRMMHSSVQEIIFEPIAALYRLSVEETEHRLKFMSAGREDVDVRCLGDGRPFAIEVSDPTRTPSAAELQQLCARISEGGQVVVNSLVLVSREDLTQLKKGEETKCKTYEALCIKLTHSPDDQLTANGESPVVVTSRDIENINSYSNTNEGARVLLQQRTPIRVLHRRPLLTRTRRIFELSAHPVPEHPQLFVVRIRTEAGTYVKEWAHGEVGRTQPRLADALRARADILALDVASVELPWPAAR